MARCKTPFNFLVEASFGFKKKCGWHGGWRSSALPLEHQGVFWVAKVLILVYGGLRVEHSQSDPLILTSSATVPMGQPAESLEDKCLSYSCSILLGGCSGHDSFLGSLEKQRTHYHECVFVCKSMQEMLWFTCLSWSIYKTDMGLLLDLFASSWSCQNPQINLFTYGWPFGSRCLYHVHVYPRRQGALFFVFGLSCFLGIEKKG